MRYSKEWYESDTLTSASGTVVIGPVNIEQYDRFCLTFKNLATAAAVVQTDLATVTMGSTPTLNWVSANTAIIATPSALGASSVTMTSAINNAYRWIRFTCHITACASLISTGSVLQVGIAGHQRYT